MTPLFSSGEATTWLPGIAIANETIPVARLDECYEPLPWFDVLRVTSPRQQSMKYLPHIRQFVLHTIPPRGKF